MTQLAPGSRDREIIYEQASILGLSHQRLVSLLLDFVETRGLLGDLNRFTVSRIAREPRILTDEPDVFEDLEEEPCCRRCGEPRDKDCEGKYRCLACDPPCPYCLAPTSDDS